ncbi:uncharacterized protein K452DRAFT_316020 [Aplosporella prunicola CBS 121167]|uniref:FAD dependent oxidoreductase domain-containing protein n=1 Tax=Aplosporella prunicola CBS 121167 TaxID=1176127 RepID=A0A6A6BQJ7_9PEZI|nr:uncharacterized protein K452DRAFT_316020 [Aplosporella prunicola CBS 121167]KAF2144861.1 hypothetical protein K452DRAFT_316020 [Aplosporella prunicola CBS 121167]
MDPKSQTVILGAGIIGLSTAYYLSESQQNIHIIEPSHELFASASGLAGGFIAADWFAPSVAPLGGLSFRLHKELAEQHQGKERWGYSLSTGTSLSQDVANEEEAVLGSGEDWLQNGTSRAEAAGGHSFSEGEGPAWLMRSNGSSLEVISRDASTAQIDPRRLCQFLLEQCTARGVQLHRPARATSVSKDATGVLNGVHVVSADGSERDLPCTRLVLTAGAWTPKVVSTLFPRAPLRVPISALAGHSLLLKSPRWSAEHEEKGCHAVFATDTLGFSPELFSRIGGEIYIAGLNSTMIPLPDVPSDCKARDDAMQQLKDVAKTMLGLPGQEDDLQVLREGLCFRPVTSSGRPIISRIPDAKLDMATRSGGEGGVFMAAGHGAWGISQSLGTGKVMAELICGQPTSVNIKALALPA